MLTSPISRRQLLALLAVPAVAGVLQACGGSEPNGQGDDVTTDPTGSPQFVLARSDVPRRPATTDEAITAVASIEAFGADLYGRLAGLVDAPNLVFSPASIATALAMTRAGAKGATAQEMDAVLHLDDHGADPSAIHRSMNALTATLESRSGTFTDMGGNDTDVTLNIANSLWGQQDLRFEPPFLDLLAAEYGAGMRLVDYRSDPEQARGEINEWVDTETKGRIPELLVPGTITPDSRLTLVNAVYLKAAWQAPFLEQLTQPADFTTLVGNTVQVPMMRSSEFSPYAEGDGWQAVQLGYVGGSLGLLLVVPEAGRFDEVEAQLGSGLVPEVAAALAPAEVNLGLPQFDIGTQADLNEVLAALGMPTAFVDGAADFTGMTTEERLFIGFVVHAANITVDEKGTEAAAATAVGMRATSAPVDPPKELTIDRPFLFALRDAELGVTLFLGRVGDPSQRRSD
jgi:serpin B